MIKTVFLMLLYCLVILMDDINYEEQTKAEYNYYMKAIMGGVEIMKKYTDIQEKQTQLLFEINDNIKLLIKTIAFSPDSETVKEIQEKFNTLHS